MIPNINLMPKIEKGPTSLKFAFILVGILSMLTIVILTLLYFGAKEEIVDTTSTRDTLIATRDELHRNVSSLDTQNQGSLQESVTFVERVSYPVTPIINETKDLLPTDTYLRSYEFSTTRVALIVDLETLNAVSIYVSNLKKSPYFNDVKVGTIEAFEIDSMNEEQQEPQFADVPRYEIEIELTINEEYIAAGGDEQ
ncbi:PilN domain-containing protein [Solibacillus sp. FSL W7-1436]|uniref:PilN domain-containing protein n=1 Tax=Solibacillus sp. FSL W7-1436 TaxID=2921705 RepID=UPI0030F8FB9C